MCVDQIATLQVAQHGWLQIGQRVKQHVHAIVFKRNRRKTAKRPAHMQAIELGDTPTKRKPLLTVVIASHHDNRYTVLADERGDHLIKQLNRFHRRNGPVKNITRDEHSLYLLLNSNGDNLSQSMPLLLQK